MKVREDPRLQAMVDWLIDRAHPEELLLFGSRAKGLAREDSDADFLAILPSDTTPDEIKALLSAVPQFNSTSRIELQLHPLTVKELCEQLQAGRPSTTENAMKDGIIFFPRDQERSRYKAFADAWRPANRVRLWLLPAESYLPEAKELARIGILGGAMDLSRRAVNEALKALLICAGGDVFSADRPTEMLTEIEAFNRTIVRPLSRLGEALDRLATLPEGQLELEKVGETLHTTEALLRYIRRAVQAVIEPDIPCP